LYYKKRLEGIRKLTIGVTLRDWKPELKIYDYFDKWFVGIIIKLKHNPILVFFWSFWNKIAWKECIKFDNKYGKDFEGLTKKFVNNFMWHRTIKRND